MIKKLIRRVLDLLPTKRLIVFESVPNLSDNSKAVFDEMIRRGMNKKYKFIWVVSNKDERLPKIKNVSYVDKTKRSYKSARRYYQRFAKVMISGNDYITPYRPEQTAFYLCHGTSVKSIRSYYNIPDSIDYIFVDGEETREMMAYETNFSLDRTIALGYPRNDILTKAPRDVKALFPNRSFEKIAVWYPTFRQHKNGHTATQKAIPFLGDEVKAAELNALAKENGILIVLKPHFAQDVSKIKACDFSNIVFINDDFFVEHNTNSYEFIAGCDALISDYSSVYFDFLLCDKPMALVWVDYEEYKATTNFCLDMDYYMKAGEKIYTIKDFGAFLENLKNGTDPLKNERAEITKWANYSNDGKSSERVTDFIIEKGKL